jgi:hypothetical protein
MLNKKLKKIVLYKLIFLLLSFLSVITFLLIENPQRGTMINKQYQTSMFITDSISYDDAIEDLEFMFKIVKERHQSTRRNIPKSLIDQYEYEINKMPNEPLVVDLLKAASRIMNKLNDAHSFVGIVFPEEQKTLNTTFNVDFEGNIYINIDNSYKKVKKMNNIDAYLLYENAKQMFSYENPYFLAYRLSQRIRYAAFLYMLGTTYNDEKATITYLEDDQEITVDLFYSLETPTHNLKAYQKEFNIDDNYAIFELNNMIYDQAYISFLNNFFTEVKNNNIENIIIDLRENGGGNSKCANEFLSFLKINSYIGYGSIIRYRFLEISYRPKKVTFKNHHEVAFDGNLFVLTSRKTFSSAAMFTTLLHDNNLAYIIGEPIGNEPSMYGDMLNYQMPNSKLGFSTTYKYFIRPNQIKTDITIYPNFDVPAKLALDYAIDIIINS